jgi:hypothetical protein
MKTIEGFVLGWPRHSPPALSVNSFLSLQERLKW